MIVLKSPQEIDAIRASGRIVATVLSEVRQMVKPGVTLLELDKRADDIVRDHGAKSSFKGYKPESAPYPFPATLCLSVNDEIVHGIPTSRKLKEGDVLKIDCGVLLNGYHGDSAITVGVGKIAPKAQKLIEITEACFWAAADKMRAGNRFGDVGAAIQTVAEPAGFSVVREYTSHGVGRDLHEGFSLLNYGTPGVGMLLRPGLTVALEPMINEGKWGTRIKKDGWTVVTIDGKLSAQFEHTVAVTDGDPQILTKLD
jgi:methionyl aminopeptidase